MPATDEVWRLQRGEDPECNAFQRFANQGHYRGKGGTRQGIYVCTPAGQLLGSINSLNAAAVTKMMTAALSAWHNMSTAQRQPSDHSAIPAGHRWESSCPEDGLILTSINRDVPATGLRSTNSQAWNRDHVWITRAEADALIPAEPFIGHRRRMQPPLAERLVRLHLVDNVRGQTLPYASQEVKQADIFLEVIAHDADTVVMELSGHTRAEADGRWLLGPGIWTPGREMAHGMTARLYGYCRYDVASRRFVEFELIALGRRWGATENNARWRDPEDSTIAFLFRLTPPGPARCIPPAFIDMYDTDWVDPSANAY